MPDTPLGITYPAQNASNDVAYHLQVIAEDVDALFTTGVPLYNNTSASQNIAGTEVTLCTIPTFNVDRPTTVLFGMTASHGSSGANDVISFIVKRNNVEVGAVSSRANSGGANLGNYTSFTQAVDLPAGASTITLHSVRAVGTVNIAVTKAQLWVKR